MRSVRHVLMAVLGVAAVCGPLHAQVTGPTPPPTRQEDWPGRGKAWAPDGYTRLRPTWWADRDKDQGAVVFLGDSITEGWHARLQPAFPTLKVANRGISADNSRSVLFRLKEDVLDLHPTAVVLLIGTNDVSGGSSPDEVAYNIRAILDGIRRAAPKAPVIVCHVMPRGILPGKPFPDAIESLNRLVDASVIGRPGVFICDTWSVFAQPDGQPLKEEFPDMLHPDDAGYAKWTAALKPVMARAGILQGENAG